MVILVVDDNAAMASTVRECTPESLVSALAVDRTMTPREIADRIVASAPTAIVFINVDLECSGYRRHEQPGVEVLKFLRLGEHGGVGSRRGHDVHCVMYSFRTLESLLRQKSSSSVLCSRGTTYRRLPFELSGLNFDALANERAWLPEWRNLLRGASHLPDDRHSWANWYAGWQLLRINALVHGATSPFAVDGLLPLDGRAERDALFIYGWPKDIEPAVARIRADSEALRATISRQLLCPGVGGQTRLALIDDQGQTIDRRTKFGWGQVYAEVLGLDKDIVIDIWASLGLADVHSDVNALLTKLNKKNLDLSEYACVLLDLRLLGERGPIDDPNLLSGAEVLKWIRSRWPALPVIVATASSRAESLRVLFDLGADAYWVKRGVDEHASGFDLARSYIALQSSVCAATHPRYQFMRRLGQALHLWLQGSKRWWTDRASAPWFAEKRPAIRTARTLLVESMVGQMLQLLRHYLRNSLMRQGAAAALSTQAWVTAMVQLTGKVVEGVHFTDTRRAYTAREIIGRGSVGDMSKKKEPIDGHRDGFGSYLMTVRNEAAHVGASPFTWADTETLLAHFTCYVILGPDVAFDGLLDVSPRREKAFAEVRTLIATQAAYQQLARRLIAESVNA